MEVSDQGLLLRLGLRLVIVKVIVGGLSLGLSLDREIGTGSLGLIRLIDCRQINKKCASSASGSLTSCLTLLALGRTTLLLGRCLAVLNLLLLRRALAWRRLLGRLAIVISGLGSLLLSRGGGCLLGCLLDRGGGRRIAVGDELLLELQPRVAGRA